MYHASGHMLSIRFMIFLIVKKQHLGYSLILKINAFNAKKFPSLNEMEIFYTLSFSLLKILNMCSYAAFSSQEKATHIPKEIKKQINALAVFEIDFRSML